MSIAIIVVSMPINSSSSYISETYVSYFLLQQGANLAHMTPMPEYSRLLLPPGSANAHPTIEHQHAPDQLQLIEEPQKAFKTTNQLWFACFPNLKIYSLLYLTDGLILQHSLMLKCSGLISDDNVRLILRNTHFSTSEVIVSYFKNLRSNIEEVAFMILKEKTLR